MKIIEKFKAWRQKKSLPYMLDSESAYGMYAIEEACDLEKVYAHFKEQVFKSIRDAATRGRYVELYKGFPLYVTEEMKKQLVTDLEALNYKVPYYSSIGIVINWRK